MPTQAAGFAKAIENPIIAGVTKTGTTLWDTSASAVVLHKKWGILRALVCTTVVFGVLILMSALNAAGNR